jgi:uncharacterized protein YciI
MFLIKANFTPNTKEKLETLRPSHLNYIVKNCTIKYGGLTMDQQDLENGILYILSYQTIKEAEDFIKMDPYHSILSNISIEKFVQKLPRL